MSGSTCATHHSAEGVGGIGSVGSRVVGFPVVGVVGGGQLARMMAAPAIGLGIELRVLARDPRDGGR